MNLKWFAFPISFPIFQLSAYGRICFSRIHWFSKKKHCLAYHGFQFPQSVSYMRVFNVKTKITKPGASVSFLFLLECV